MQKKETIHGKQVLIVHKPVWNKCLFLFSGDFIGYVLAWCSLLPIFSIVGFITLILFRRDLHTVSRCIFLIA